MIIPQKSKAAFRWGRNRLAFVVVAAGIFAASESRADQWGSPVARAVRSPNGAWIASLTPGWGDGMKSRVIVRPKRAHAAAKGWDREPLNPVAPVDFFVSNSGALVTLGEWHNEGSRNAVVLYNEIGNVITAHTLESFLTEADLKKTRQTVSSRWWRYTAEVPEYRGDGFFHHYILGRLASVRHADRRGLARGTPFR